LFDDFRTHVDNGRYVVGLHASERLEERGILEWQAAAGLADGKLLIERPRDEPNPAIAHAEHGDLAWLRRIGKVYELVEA
jgi:hypothetical protein